MQLKIRKKLNSDWKIKVLIQISVNIFVLGNVTTYIHVPPPPSAHSAHTHNTTLGYLE